MAISASDVKALREETGAGMMDCKNALVEAEGDMDKARGILEKKGQRKVQKAASRTAAEGRIMAAISGDGQSGALIEINCETDFVGRDEGFLAFCEKASQAILDAGESNIDEINALPYGDGNTIEEARQALVTKIGENIKIRRAQTITANGDLLGAYVHDGRIGAIARIKGGDAALAKDLAMHMAAMNPQYITLDEVPADVVAKEKENATERFSESGKPANVIEKMIEGQVNKYLGEICFMGQAFIKEPKKTVSTLLTENKAELVSIERFEVGEGIEVSKKSFQEEVMEQARGE